MQHLRLIRASHTVERGRPRQRPKRSGNGSEAFRGEARSSNNHETISEQLRRMLPSHWVGFVNVETGACAEWFPDEIRLRTDDERWLVDNGDNRVIGHDSYGMSAFRIVTGFIESGLWRMVDADGLQKAREARQKSIDACVAAPTMVPFRDAMALVGLSCDSGRSTLSNFIRRWNAKPPSGYEPISVIFTNQGRYLDQDDLQRAWATGLRRRPMERT